MDTDAVAPKQIKAYDHPNLRVAWNTGPAIVHGKTNAHRRVKRFD
jgi:hypothetical protein